MREGDSEMEETRGSEPRDGVSRRRLLKIAVAAGGAVAASTVLPGRWMKPVANLGYLPAHAQVSDLFSVGDLRISRGSVDFDFAYVDPLGEVDNSTFMAVFMRGGTGCPDTTLVRNSSLFDWNASIVGSPSKGRIMASENSGYSYSYCGSPLCNVEAHVQLFANGRVSTTSPWENVPDDGGCVGM